MTKLTTKQQSEYDGMVRTAVKSGNTIVSKQDRRRLTIEKLVALGMLELHTEHWSEHRVQYHITENLFPAYVEQLEQIKLRKQERAIEQQMLSDLADKRKAEVCERFMIEPGNIQVSAKVEYSYETEDSYRTGKQFICYTFEIGAVIESQYQDETYHSFKGFANVNTSYNGKAPDISWHSTTSDPEYAHIMARSIHLAAQIVKAGLWK